jgi:hypothetical protein
MAVFNIDSSHGEEPVVVLPERQVSAFLIDIQSAMQRSTYPPEQGIFYTTSGSSLPLPNLGAGEPVNCQFRPPPSLRPVYLRLRYPCPTHHVGNIPRGCCTQSPLSRALHPSPASRPELFRNLTSIFSRRVTGSLASSIHSRSLPTPPTPSSSQ